MRQREAVGLLRTICLSLPLALAFVGPAMAGDSGRQPFTVIDEEHGLPPGAPLSVTQDADGFIWFGTEQGLVRYEGAQSRRWTLADGLPSAFVPRVVATPDGSVWAGTAAGLVRVRQGRVERATFGRMVSSEPVTQMVRDRKGRLWVATAQDLFVQAEGASFTRQPRVPWGHLSGLVAGPRTGAMYLAGEGGICAFLADGTIRTWGPSDGLPPGGPTIVAEDGAGRLWAGAGRTLVVKEPGSSRFMDQSRRLQGALYPVSVPFVDRDGSVWLPGQHGATRLSGDRTEWLDVASGLPFGWVRTVFRDREGTLWVLGVSVARLEGGGRVWNYTVSPGAIGEVVWFVGRDPEGRLLVTTDNGAMRMESGGFRRIAGTEGQRVTSAAVDREGTLWLISPTGPTLWLRAGERAATVAPLGPLGDAMNSLTVDRSGRVWLGHTREGLLRWDPSTRQLVREVAPSFAGTPQLGIQGIDEDSRGRLWLATNAGLLVREPDGRWQRFTDRDGLSTSLVRGMAFAPDGTAWVFFQEPAGLDHVRLDGGRLTVLQQHVAGRGLRSRIVYAVRMDAGGHVWASTEQGLDRLAPPLHIGRYDGMISEDCSVRALFVDGDRIWVGTAGGLVRYDMAGRDPVFTPPRAYVLDMTYGTRRIEPPFASLPPLSFRDATVEFRVAVPSYANEHDATVQVRLVGLENDWRTISESRVHYASLPGGAYRFEVRAGRGDGAFGPVAGLDFRVQPPWWRSWWAYALAVVSGFAALAFFVRLHESSLARSKAALEELVAERTSELQVRNDELSAALSNVKQLSGLLPICSNCKKLRDDQGYWNQLEEYISEHSDVRFSHGICPECARKLYPDLVD